MKILSHSIAKAVMQFWHSVELLLVRDNNCIGSSNESGQVDSNEASGDKTRSSDMLQVIYFGLL